MIPQISPTKAHGAYSSFFSSPQAIELTLDPSQYPSALQASDGTIWVAWQQYYELGVYETFSTSGGWSGILNLPTGNQFTISPALSQFGNGSIIVLWSSNQTGHWNLYYRFNSYGVWGGINQLTQPNAGPPFNDYFPTVAVSTNSTVYVFWERFFSPTSVNIFYKTLKGNVWSQDIQLQSSPNGNVDVSPGALATYDGKIWLAWSRLSTVSGNYNIYYTTYDGTMWSGGSVGLLLPTISNTYDVEPSLVQDRNGTILVFFSRQMLLAGGTNPIYQQKLWYKYTFDGSVWAPDTQLTSYGDVNTPLNDFSPSVIQGFDKSVWIFYSTNYPIGSEYDIYYIKSLAIYPTHNVVLKQVQSGPYGFQRSISTVLITLSNQGDFVETVQLTITAKNATTLNIVTGVAETLQIGKTATFVFSWNTTLVPVGMYTITASYPSVNGQTVLASGGDRLQYRFFTLLPPIRPRVCNPHGCVV
jgi:hypothetical protein